MVNTLEEMKDHFGSKRRVCVCREISKIFEETKRGALSDVKDYYTQNPPKGEIVSILDGKKKTG